MCGVKGMCIEFNIDLVVVVVCLVYMQQTMLLDPCLHLSSFSIATRQEQNSKHRSYGSHWNATHWDNIFKVLLRLR